MRRSPGRLTASEHQVIEELCRICEALNHIVKVQASALAQLGAAVLEEERAEADRALAAVIGNDETPNL